MYATKYEPESNIIVDQPIAYKGKASVMQTTLLELLKEAAKVYRKPNKKNHGLPEHAYITLLTDEDCYLTAEIWDKSGQYVRLPKRIGAKVERPFRMAVNLEILHKLIKQASPERVDLKTVTESHVLNVCVGSMANDLPALPDNELPPVNTAKPMQAITKELESELTWLKQAIDMDVSRSVLMYAFATTIDQTPVIAAANGYRLHLSTNHVEGLDGYIDVKGIGSIPEQAYVNFQRFTELEWQSNVAVLRDSFEQAVKTAMVFSRDSANSVKFAFKDGILTITDCSAERGDVSTVLRYTPASFEMYTSLNGKYVLDAVRHCDGFAQPHDVNEPHFIKLQFGIDGQSPTCIMAHEGRAAIIMPLQITR